MILIVDGYNLYFTGLCPGHEPGEIREAREHVVAVVSNYMAGRSGKAIVYFDGGPGGAHLPRVQWSRGIEQRFSAPRDDADTDIKEAVEDTGPGEDVRVVTSDNAIASFARRNGASVIKSQAFARQVTPSSEPADARADEPPAKYTGGTPRQEVDYWLRVFTEGDEEA